MNSLQIQKGYNKLTSTSSPRTNLIYTLFPISSHEQETQWFHSPKVFTNVSQPKWTSHQRHLTLKLPHLIHKLLYLETLLKTWRINLYILHGSRATIEGLYFVWIDCYPAIMPWFLSVVPLYFQWLTPNFVIKIVLRS